MAEATQERVRPLTKEELEALTKDLQDVLVKHNAEMGVTSTINLMRVLDNEPATTEEETPAETNSQTETGS